MTKNNIQMAACALLMVSMVTSPVMCAVFGNRILLKYCTIVSSVSCRGRCGEVGNPLETILDFEAPVCSCDINCAVYVDCCWDFFFKCSWLYHRAKTPVPGADVLCVNGVYRALVYKKPDDKHVSMPGTTAPPVEMSTSSSMPTYKDMATVQAILPDGLTPPPPTPSLAISFPSTPSIQILAPYSPSKLFPLFLNKSTGVLYVSESLQPIQGLEPVPMLAAYDGSSTPLASELMPDTVQLRRCLADQILSCNSSRGTNALASVLELCNRSSGNVTIVDCQPQAVYLGMRERLQSANHILAFPHSRIWWEQVGNSFRYTEQVSGLPWRRRSCDPNMADTPCKITACSEKYVLFDDVTCLAVDTVLIFSGVKVQSEESAEIENTELDSRPDSKKYGEMLKTLKPLSNGTSTRDKLDGQNGSIVSTERSENTTFSTTLKALIEPCTQANLEEEKDSLVATEQSENSRILKSPKPLAGLPAQADFEEENDRNVSKRRSGNSKISKTLKPLIDPNVQNSSQDQRGSSMSKGASEVLNLSKALRPLSDPSTEDQNDRTSSTDQSKNSKLAKSLKPVVDTGNQSSFVEQNERSFSEERSGNSKKGKTLNFLTVPRVNTNFVDQNEMTISEGRSENSRGKTLNFLTDINDPGHFEEHYGITVSVERSENSNISSTDESAKTLHVSSIPTDQCVEIYRTVVKTGLFGDMFVTSFNPVCAFSTGPKSNPVPLERETSTWESRVFHHTIFPPSEHEILLEPNIAIESTTSNQHPDMLKVLVLNTVDEVNTSPFVLNLNRLATIAFSSVSNAATNSLYFCLVLTERDLAKSSPVTDLGRHFKVKRSSFGKAFRDYADDSNIVCIRDSRLNNNSANDATQPTLEIFFLFVVSLITLKPQC